MYDKAIPLKVSGIIRPNEDTSAGMISSSIGYTKALTEYIIENAKDSDLFICEGLWAVEKLIQQIG